jgi:hypothetical protein
MNLMKINPDEIRSIVGKLVAQGRAVVPPEKPKRGKYSGRTGEQNKLRVIACDQCGTKFMKRCAVQIRCSPECSRKANTESVRRWHVRHGLRGVPHGVLPCDYCGESFQKTTRGHRFCSPDCRRIGIKIEKATKPTTTTPTTKPTTTTHHGHTK